jgi:phosphoserine phosphatase RsbU/P
MSKGNISNLPSILIVDDNVKNLQILGSFLQKEEILVEFALDGISALDWLERKRFDLILLDIMMPGMDGFEVNSIIKKKYIDYEIPVIFITAKSDSESIVRAYEAGAVDYITKPFIQSELLARVLSQLNIKKTNEKNIRYLHEIEEQNRNINESIEYARYIQNAISSFSKNNLEYLPEHFILDLPKDVLSGDFYWLHKADNKFIIAVMDCTGHGIPGALMSIMGTSLLNETVIHNHIEQPDKILESIRSKIIYALGQEKGTGYIKDGIEGTVLCFDFVSNKLMYSGSFNPLIFVHDDEIFELKTDRIPIGYYEKEGNFNLHHIDIEKNDIIYLFSDGMSDQFGGPKIKKFMLKKLKEVLKYNHNMPMALQKEILLDEFYRWKGDIIQTDDILILGIRF